MSLIGQTDSTKIKVQYQDSVAREGFFLLPDPLLSSLNSSSPHALAPGMENEQYTWQMTFNRFLEPPFVTQLDLYDVFPHMHERGKKLRAKLDYASGGEQCIADVQHWDFGRVRKENQFVKATHARRRTAPPPERSFSSLSEGAFSPPNGSTIEQRSFLQEAGWKTTRACAHRAAHRSHQQSPRAWAGCSPAAASQ